MKFLSISLNKITTRGVQRVKKPKFMEGIPITEGVNIEVYLMKELEV